MECIAAIKEAIAPVNHPIAGVDKWEQAHFSENEIRVKVRLPRCDTKHCAKSWLLNKNRMR